MGTDDVEEGRAARLLRRFVAYPILAAVFPVVSLFEHNQHEAFLFEVARPLAYAVLGGAAAWALFAILLRDKDRGAVVALVVVALFYGYGHARPAFMNRVEVPLEAAATLFDLLWVFLLLGGFLVALLAGERARAARPVLNVVALAVLLVPASSVAWYAAEREGGSVLSPATAGGAAGARPNVYYVVLDMYAHEDTLREHYGWDNGPFLDALRERGFYVADESRSNYALTFLSLSSALNMDYLRGFDPDSRDRSVAHDMVRDNLVAAELGAHGYRHVHFRSGYGATAANPHADWTVRCSDTTEFQRTLYSTTFLGRFEKEFVTKDRERVECYFDRLARLPEAKGPLFVVAHLVSPHPPFLFGPDGEAVDAEAHGVAYNGSGDVEAAKRLYVGQLRYLNERVLGFVDAVRAKEEVPPIIVVQSDHGPAYTGDLAEPDPTLLRERLRNLNAVHLPGGEDGLYPQITPVNTFRVVLDHVLGTERGLLPDRSLHSDYGRPYAWTDVTEIVDFDPATTAPCPVCAG